MDEIDRDLISTRGTCEPPKEGKRKPWDGHTPLPWVARRGYEDYYEPDPEEREEYESRPFTQIKGPKDSTVVTAHDLFAFRPGDAALIVHRVNTYDALVAALHKLCGDVEVWGLTLTESVSRSQRRTALEDSIADAQGVLKMAMGHGE